MKFAIHILLLMTPAYSYGSSIDNLAGELLTLRSEVEELQDTLDEKKATQKNELQSKNLVYSDLLATNQRLELQTRQLEEKLRAATEALEETFSGDRDLVGFVLTGLSQMKQHVDNSLPFKKSERKASLDAINTKLENKSISPYKAAHLLWSFWEDELRLLSDVSLQKQVVSIDDKELLCDVAKLGMMALFVKTPNEQYGKIIRKENQWSYLPLTESQDKQAVEDLFTSLQKQIRVGSFKLPAFI